jgi:ABC-type phosphate transport system substrate-binding protein
MRRRRSIGRLLAFAMIVLGLANTSIAGDDGGFKVIVNPELPVDAADRDLLRDVYLKKTTEWGNGDTAHPVDLASKFPARDRFTEHVIRKTPAQLRTYWNQQIFSGKGVPPPEADSVADAVAYVVATKGAVGYIPADADPGRAKVIRLK